MDRRACFDDNKRATAICADVSCSIDSEIILCNVDDRGTAGSQDCHTESHQWPIIASRAGPGSTASTHLIVTLPLPEGIGSLGQVLDRFASCMCARWTIRPV